MEASKFFREEIGIRASARAREREKGRERGVLEGVRRSQEDVKIPAEQVKGSRGPLAPLGL